jgi:hypothetical protein
VRANGRCGEKCLVFTKARYPVWDLERCRLGYCNLWSARDSFLASRCDEVSQDTRLLGVKGELGHSLLMGL